MICAVTRDGKQIKSFIDLWHSTHKAPVGWRVAFSLLFGGNLVGISTWGRPTARLEDQVSTLEHTRMALTPEAPRNSGSWFLARNREWIRSNLPEIRRLIAYVNLANHKGTIYLADNWKVVYRKRDWNTWKNRAGRQGTEARLRAKFERVP
jgi:hypothetical protein